MKQTSIIQIFPKKCVIYVYIWYCTESHNVKFISYCSGKKSFKKLHPRNMNSSKCTNKPMQGIRSSTVYNSKRKLETIQMPTVNLLKEKGKWCRQKSWVYSGIAKKLQFRTSKLRQTTGKSRERKDHSFIEERRKLGRAVLNRSSSQETKVQHFGSFLIGWAVAG